MSIKNVALKRLNVLQLLDYSVYIFSLNFEIRSFDHKPCAPRRIKIGHSLYRRVLCTLALFPVLSKMQGCNNLQILVLSVKPHSYRLPMKRGKI